MAQVRIVKAIGNDGEGVSLFVYRGYYARVNGTAAYHTNQILRNGVKLNNITDNDVFHLDSNKFENKEIFKNIVDDVINNIINSFGSLNYYYLLNS
jgi:hypothetical protein